MENSVEIPLKTGNRTAISSVIQSCPTLCDPMDHSMPGLPVHHQLPEFTQTHVHQVGDAIQPSHPLSSLLPSIFPSIRVFSNESLLPIRWPKYSSFSFNISPSNEYSRLISFRMDWLDLAIRETLKSSPTPQLKSINSLELSFLYSPTFTSIRDYWKNHSFHLSLLFNMQSRFVIAFLPRSMSLLISWLQSPSSVILEPPKIKSDTVSIVSTSICHEMTGPDAMILLF